MTEYIDKTFVERMLKAITDDEELIINALNSLPTADVIAIPENATNGDVLKAMFPQWNLREDIRFEYKLFGENHKFEGLVDEDWWKEPYKRMEEQHE